MAKTNPLKLTGAWKAGYALDRHTLSSTFVGHDQYGHAMFDTTRTAVGELLYQLKYQEDREAVEELSKTAASFVKSWGIEIDAIIPVPPSNASRKWQPVLALASRMSEILGVRLWARTIVKSKPTAELKAVFDKDKRQEILSDVFSAKPNAAGRKLLVVDDLYRSGATLEAIVAALGAAGAANVYVLTFTRTTRNT